MITIKELAQLAGVSVATVSRAFADDSVIKPETREKILSIARERGYSPNHIARSLKQQRSMTVGVLIYDIENPFYLQVIKPLETHLRAKGYRLMMMFAQIDNPESEGDALRRFAESRVDAILFTARRTDNEALVREIASRGIILLQIYANAFTFLPSVVVDDVYGAFLGMSELIKKGHRRIMFADVVRDEGAVRACRFAGLRPEDTIVPLPTDEESITRLIREKRVTALFACNYRQFMCCFKAISQLGLGVGRDISLLVYDDLPWLAAMDISAIGHPLDSIAEIIAYRTLSLLEAGEAAPQPAVTSITPILVSRSSIHEIGA